MQTINVHPAGRLIGELKVPGDKSISHRIVMLAGLGDHPVRVQNFLFADDCCSTIACMQALGADISRTEGDELIIIGRGLHGLIEPEDVLDAGNSGTTMRLLTGILSAQPFLTLVTGDASLRKRPMGRIIKPLSAMGALIQGRSNNRYAPLAVLPAERLRGIDYMSDVASAQVKSAVLLAGLFAGEPTSVTEPVRSRDHTELMLTAFGVDLKRDEKTVHLSPPTRLAAPEQFEVPGDISSAAFWLVAASILPGSCLRLNQVGVNPTRTGILDALTRMGADITLMNQRLSGQEPVADLIVKAAPLKSIILDSADIPRIIDEIPVLAVAALAAEGTTVIRGARELRIKETDRLAAVARELGKLGASITELPDGLEITGPQKLSFATCHSQDDHRMAMMLAVAGAFGAGAQITNTECVRISYPNFFTELNRLAGCVEEFTE